MKKLIDIIKEESSRVNKINPKELFTSMTEVAKKKTTTKKVRKAPVMKINYISIEPATNGIIIEVSRGINYDNEKIVCATTDAAQTCLENLITEIRSQ